MTGLVAPFPWFGGKRRVAAEVWKRFGNPSNYVEPFFGSGAVLLSRSEPCRVETVNDADGLLCNLWRAIKSDPDGVTSFADWPVSELDLTARHAWLVGQRERITERLEADPDFFDVKAAGWWLWGICAWIGSGWCSGEGPWVVRDGKLQDLGDAGQGINRKLPHLGDAGRGINRQLPHLGTAGQGINRKLPHLGNAGQGINRQVPHLGNAGQGINRQLPHLGNAGQGINRQLLELSDRLRRVRVACGDWSRVLGDSVTWRHGTTAVFLDPPYPDGEIDYAVGSRSVADDVRVWAANAGRRSDMRIALCGYDEHNELADLGWSQHRWKAHGGYSSQDGENENASRETIWFSPACIPAEGDMPLFARVQ